MLRQNIILPSKQVTPIKFRNLCLTKTDDVPETDVLRSASGGIYPLLDPQSKDEVTTETEIFKVLRFPVE